MFNFQRVRFFPLPDYDLSGGKVKVTITGNVLDVDYANLLARNQDLSLEEIIMLDKVQKKIPISKSEEKHLKSKHLIEGRRPNYFIDNKVAQKTGQKAAYSKNRAFDKKHYLDLIELAIRECKSVNRSDIDDLLWKKLPDWMNDNQRKIKINNLLSELRSKGRIKNEGNDAKPKWVLIDPNKDSND